MACEDNDIMKEEQKITNLEDAEKLITQLQNKIKCQSLKFLAWHRKFKIQEEMLIQVTRDQNEQLEMLSAKMIVFEAKLLRKQGEISKLLAHREAVISKQQRTIKILQNNLANVRGDGKQRNSASDYINDSDSAVIIEEDDNIVLVENHSSGNGLENNIATTTVVVDDVLESSNIYHGKNIPLHSTQNEDPLLKMPETPGKDINFNSENLEEYDYLMELNNNINLPNGNTIHHKINNSHKLQKIGKIDEFADNLLISEEEPNKLEEDKPVHQESTNQVVTYNRVMNNNHRSVTKPKDVKYRRINKAKSKSLEELRGRLKNWVGRSNKFTFSFDHST